MNALLDVWDGVRALPLFGLGLTLLAYEAALAMQRRAGGSVLLNPVLVSTGAVIAVLQISGVSYEDYMRGGGLLSLLLGPATVALALPLFRHATQFRRSALPLAAASLVGACVACATAVGIAAALGAPDVVLRSLAPKTATVAIAIGVSEQIGGVPALTAALVVGTGMIGAVIARWVLDLAGIDEMRVRGLAIGVASHGIGTAYALSVDAEIGAFAGFGMSVTGLFTGLLLPSLWRLL